MSRLPTISISSRPALFGQASRTLRLAGATGVECIGLDLSTPFARQVAVRQSMPVVPVTTIWLGNPWNGLWSGEAQLEQLGAWVQRADPPAVVVDLDRTAKTNSRPGIVIGRSEQTRRLVGRDRRILIAIRAVQLSGGRRHLSELTALRHLAEEWDLGIALDLTGNLDPTWEAEAAVFRLGNHLQLLRIPTAATDRLAVGRARVGARALGAALDQGVPPEITLVPSLSLVQGASDRARAQAITASVSAIQHRVARYTTERAQFLNQNLWPNLRG